MFRGLLHTIKGFCANRPWLIWFVAALFATFQFMLQSAPSVLAGELHKEFHLSRLAIGLFSSIYFYSYLACQIPAGLLVDKVGPRKILLCAVPLAAVFCLLTALTHNNAVLFSTRLMLGMVTAPAMVSALFLASNWFNPRQFALVAGLTECLCIAGGGLSQKLLAMTTMSWGFQGSMLAASMTAFFLFVLVYLFIQDYPTHSPDIHRAKPPAKAALQSIFKSKNIVFTGIYAGFAAALIGAFAGLWGIGYLQNLYHISLSQAATGTALILSGIGISSVSYGYLSDKTGKRVPYMLGGGVCSFLLLMAILFVPMRLEMMYFTLFLLGLAAGSYVLSFALAKDLSLNSASAVTAGFINMMSMAVGALILQPLIGGLIEHEAHGLLVTHTHYSHALSVLPLSMFLGLIALAFIREDKTHSPHLMQVGRARIYPLESSVNSLQRPRKRRLRRTKPRSS